MGDNILVERLDWLQEDVQIMRDKVDVINQNIMELEDERKALLLVIEFHQKRIDAAIKNGVTILPHDPSLYESRGIPWEAPVGVNRKSN